MENVDNTQDPESQKEKELFENLEIKYTKSKADIWAEMDKIIVVEQDVPQSEPKVIRMKWLKPAIAATLITLIASGLFMRLYTIEVQMKAGEFATHELPDGSKIHLNAASTISYAPYWWRFNREIELTGEAFFEVEKGKTFTVTSEMGATEVLGTSFNIYARDNEYQVFCATGKVKVSDLKGKNVILTPGGFTEIENKQLSTKDRVQDEILSWRLNKFIYNTTPLSKVFSDMERHYSIHIEYNARQIKSLECTAIFDRMENPLDALHTICLSFGLEIDVIDDNSYKIK